MQPGGGGGHTSDNLDLGNSVRVTENNTDLRRVGTLPGKLADLLLNLVGGGLEPVKLLVSLVCSTTDFPGDEPAWGSPGVGNRGGRNTLSVRVKATHLFGFSVVVWRGSVWRCGVAGLLLS